MSFLRTDQDFLSAAVKHPSASFLIFKSLAPLSQSPSKLAWVGYDDVSGLVGDGPFSRSEQDVIADFNSVVTVPQLVFLGIDEKRAEDGLRWKKYAGAPFWALDVAPKGTVVDQAGKVVDAVQSRGLKFVEGRLNSTLAAPEGPSAPPSSGMKCQLNRRCVPFQLPSTPKLARCSIGTHGILTARNADSPRSLSTAGPNGPVRQQTSL